MNATAMLGDLVGHSFVMDMADQKKKKKITFDADEDVAEMLDKISGYGVTKGALMNACARKAWKAALDDLIERLRAAQKPPQLGGERKPKEGSKL